MPTITFNRSARRDVEEVFTVNGRSFAWWMEHDDDHGAPWEEEDGHGPVSGWEGRDKRPGELVLREDRHSKRFYDFAHAVQVAREEGWDAPPYGEGTAGQRAHRAAMADFNRLRDWCNDRWHYVGVCVQEVEDGAAVGHVASVWGIESDAGDYLRETALELAEELAPEVVEAPEPAGEYESMTSHMIAEEIQSQREADALALVEELARVTLNPITEAVNGRLAGFVGRAREIIGNA